MLGESSRLSLSASGSFTNAALGDESADGDGSPELEVTHKMPSGSIAFVAVQPGGSAGGVTPSKFSLNTVIGSGHRDSGTHASSASTLDRLPPPSPPAANTLAPIDVPDANERSWFMLGASDQLSVPGSYTNAVVLMSGTWLLLLPLEAFRPGTGPMLLTDVALLEL